MGDRVGIQLLGPVELRTATDGFVALPGPQRRAVLALLALRLGRVVAVERFFELLWGEEPPARARAALQGHIAALRKVLADTPFDLCTRAPGYLLTGPPEQVDGLRFETLAALAAEHADHPGRAGDAEAIGRLEQALGLWTGAALADLPDTELRRALAGRLEENRTRALIDWARLRLRQGSGAAAVPALEQRVRADGLREEVVALLIRCLHQAGRPADALAVYHHARELLDRELGMVPGAELQAALSQVLTEEPADPGPAGPGAAARPEAPEAAAGPEALSGAEGLSRAEGPSLAEALSGAGAAAGSGGPVRSGSAAEPAPRHEPDPDEPSAPRQLPRQPAGFVGRAPESRWLDQECGPERTGDGLAVVVGPAGTGKSATVVRWAHQAAAGFPDGQLFVDLRGFDPAGPVDPAEVLGQFLLALGVPESTVPEDPAGRAALYRARTADLRLLVLLDNARNAGHIADLLPAGPDCATVVTSRSTLEDLVVTEGAAMLRMGALPDGDALRLLERSLAPERVRAEASAAEQLIELCDHLPLALRIATSRLAARPDWTIADLVAELADERTRLLALEADGAVSIRSALMLTYRHLSARAATLLTLLAAHPGRDVDTPAAAALLNAGPAAARAALGELAAHHLLGESAPGRYSRHDLIRLFSVELLAEQPDETRRLVLERLLDYYVTAVQHCGDHLQPGQDSYGERVHPPAVLPPATDTRSALGWFRAEQSTIRALVATATAADPERAWRLAMSSSALYYGSSRLTDWLSCLRAGERAALQCGDRLAIALLREATANALLGLERRTEAAVAIQRAVDDTTPADGFAHTRSLATQSLSTGLLGDPAGGAALAAAAVELAEESGDPHELSFTLGYAASASLMAGDPEGALRRARKARALLPDRPAATIHAWSMLTEAHALQALGLAEASELAWARLLVTCEQAGFLHLHAVSEQAYAAFLQTLGREAEALEHLRAAVGLYRLHGHQAGSIPRTPEAIERALAHGTPRRTPLGDARGPVPVPHQAAPGSTAGAGADGPDDSTGAYPGWAARTGRSARIA
ncbi:BTAD domain-containing putative transcriptional regulator [Kitasatospora sp. NPDC058170]|uniref:AfsR/SARP family transcriptional regulator n=1 Tax=Kitasatospora sp. NPDC058170 TaxID=3346364 RepID=UPI0036DD4F5C